MSNAPPERTITNPRMQAIVGPQDSDAVGGFGRPTTDPGLSQVPVQAPILAPPQPAPPPAPPVPPGVTIPSWVMQIIPVIALVAGAIMLFAQQRADVEQLKTSLAEIKVQQQVYVTKQIFDLKMTEYEKYQVQMNNRFDKLEGLINGLYERLPAKQHEK